MKAWQAHKWSEYSRHARNDRLLVAATSEQEGVGVSGGHASDMDHAIVSATSQRVRF